MVNNPLTLHIEVGIIFGVFEITAARYLTNSRTMSGSSHCRLAAGSQAPSSLLETMLEIVYVGIATKLTWCSR